MMYVDIYGRSIPEFDEERQYRNGWMNLSSKFKYEIYTKEKQITESIIDYMPKPCLKECSKFDITEFSTPKIIIDTKPTNYFIKDQIPKLVPEKSLTDYFTSSRAKKSDGLF